MSAHSPAPIHVSTFGSAPGLSCWHDPVKVSKFCKFKPGFKNGH
jgi:hypothetical protein